MIVNKTSKILTSELVLAKSLLSRYARDMPAKYLQRAGGEGIYSHIYNKSIENRLIFNDQEDYSVFIGFLNEYLSAPKNPETTKKDFSVNGRIFRGTPHQPKNYFNKVELVAYCLLPDHFHLLLHQVTEGALEKFIRSLCTRYSMYFNKKYKRTGALFAGTYKSVRIDEGPILARLSRYLHRGGTHTSYSEFLGDRQFSWVNPKPVLAILADETSYKDYVEKEQSDTEAFTHKITIDTADDHLERSTLASTLPIDATPEPRSHVRTPVFLTLSIAVFLCLVTLGIRNIQATTAKNSQSTSVLGEEVTTTPQPTEIPHVTPEAPVESSSAIPEPTPEATASATSSETTSAAIPKTILRVILPEDSASVNIRREASTSSKLIGKAHNGDTFEFVSKDSEWYEISLPDGTTAFISATFVEEEVGSEYE